MEERNISQVKQPDDSPKKNHRVPLLVIIFVLLLLVAAIFLFVSGYANKLFGDQSETATIADSNQPSVNVGNSEVNLNSLTQSVGDCFSTANPSGCLKRLSLDRSDITICDEILKVPSIIPGGQGFLKDDCVYHRLIEDTTATPEQCNTMISGQTPKRLCSGALAILLNRPDLCSNETCIGTIAVQKSDLDLCNSISDGNTKNWCLARITKNPELCKQISGGLSDWWQWECLEYIGLAQKDITICQQISQENIYKWTCLAVLGNDITHCKDSNYCITQVAMVNGDAAICNNIPVTDNEASLNNVEKQACSALAKRDVTACDAMDSSIYQSEKTDCRKQINLLNANGTREVRGDFID